MLDDQVTAVLQRAVEDARQRGHGWVTVEHLACELLETPRGAEVVERAGGDVVGLRLAIADRLGPLWRAAYRDAPAELTVHPRSNTSLQRAIQYAQGAGLAQVSIDFVLAALHRDDLGQVLAAHGATRLAVLRYLSHGIASVPRNAAPLPRAWWRPNAKRAARDDRPPLPDVRCRVVMHNDHFTTRELVVAVLVEIFDKTAAEANALVASVHTDGVGIAGTYLRADAIAKIDRAHAAAAAHEFPFRLSMEALDPAG